MPTYFSNGFYDEFYLFSFEFLGFNPSGSAYFHRSYTEVDERSSTIMIAHPDGQFEEFVYEAADDPDTQFQGYQTFDEVTEGLSPTVVPEMAVSQTVTDFVVNSFPVFWTDPDPFATVYGLDTGETIAIRAFFKGDGDHGSDWALTYNSFSEAEIAALQEEATTETENEDMVDDFNEVQFVLNDEDNIAEGTQGADHIQGFDGNDRLLGRDGDDTIEGDRGDNVIFGQAGNDTLYGGAGNNYVDGGIGDDVIYTWGMDDRVQGDDGNDTIYAGADRTTLVLEEIADAPADRAAEIDLVHGFTLGTDKIEILGQDLSDDAAAQQFLEQTASIEGEDVFLHFADGRALRLIEVVEEDPDATTQDRLDELVDLF